MKIYNKNKGDYTERKWENIQEENIDLSETLCQKINSKTKRNWSFRELHEKELPIKTSFTIFFVLVFLDVLNNVLLIKNYF